MPLVLIFVFLTSVTITAYTPESGEGWLNLYDEDNMYGWVEAEVFASASNGTVTYAPGSNSPTDFNNLRYVFTANPGFTYDSMSYDLSETFITNPGMDEIWGESGNDGGTTPNLSLYFDLVLDIDFISDTVVEIGVTLVRNSVDPELFINALREPELRGLINVSFVDEEEPPLPDLYAVRVSTNIPGTGAIFSGYGTGFADGAPYDVGLVSFDSANFTFDGWSASTSGNIPGADVELVANFSPIVIPVTYTVSASANIPGTGAVFSGTGTGFPDGATYAVSLDSYDEANYVFTGWSQSPNGNIEGADVALVANFEEVVPDEPTPEDPPVEPTPEPEPEFLDEVVPEEVPEALPETGGIPSNALAFAGLSFIGFGLILRKKF